MTAIPDFSIRMQVAGMRGLLSEIIAVGALSKVAPRAARGLKHQMDNFCEKLRESRPVRARGLKQVR